MTINFANKLPYPHAVIDNFFPENTAKKLESEFPDYDSPIWHVYDNALENKKTCNDWNKFPKETYFHMDRLVHRYDHHLFYTGALLSDPGLHGGGWHIHANGGNLNPHLDYSIHPKLKLQRKMNLIVYLSSDFKSEYGGEFGFFDKEGNLLKKIEPEFNRAILFETTNAWHGLVSAINAPKGVYRKSIAVYYLCTEFNGDKRERALFLPRESQKGDKEIEALIEKRSDVNLSQEVYRKK